MTDPALEYLYEESIASSTMSVDEDGMGCEGLDMSTIFSTVPLPLTVDAGSETVVPVATSPTVSIDPKNLTHEDLLRIALEESGLSSHKWSRRRVPKKFAVDARVLQKFTENPNAINLNRTCSKRQQTKAFNEFRHWYMRATGGRWKDSVHQVCAQVRNLSNQQRYHWYLVSQARQATGLTACPPGFQTGRPSTASTPAGVSGAEPVPPDADASNALYGPGVQLTYFPKIGQDNPTVLGWIRDGLRGVALRNKLKTLPEYSHYFEQFTAFIRQLCKNLGFFSCCCCMEMGEHFRFVAAVHLHAYLGFLKVKGGLDAIKHIRIPRQDLEFCNLKPFPVVTKGFRGRRLIDAMAQGMHYVCGPKSTGMYRYTDLEPVKDRVSSKRCN